MTIINGAKGSPNALHFNTSSMDGDGAWLAVHPRGGGIGKSIELDEAGICAAIQALAAFLPESHKALHASVSSEVPEQPTHETRAALLGEVRSIFPDASVDEVIEAAWFLLDGTTRLDGPEYVFAGRAEPRVINEGDGEPPPGETEWIDRGGRTWTRSKDGWRWRRDADRQWSTRRPWGCAGDRLGPDYYLPLTEIVA